MREGHSFQQIACKIGWWCLQEYISWGGAWQAASTEQASGYNELLAEVIAEGGSAGAARPASLAATIQDIPLRMALVGAPFAGKTAMALKLADEYGCKASAAPSALHTGPSSSRPISLGGRCKPRPSPLLQLIA